MMILIIPASLFISAAVTCNKGQLLGQIILLLLARKKRSSVAGLVSSVIVGFISKVKTIISVCMLQKPIIVCHIHMSVMAFTIEMKEMMKCT